MKHESLSTLLRTQRLRKGLSLSQLARLVDTSPATLSRYENGWQRFEVGTLRKIASALGCRLCIELGPLYVEEEVCSKRTLAKRIGRLFWDKPLKRADLDRYPKWVVRRVLELGTLADVRALVFCMGRERFLKIVAETRFSSSRTQIFWENMLRKENVSCTKRHFPRTAENFWPT